MAGKPLSLPSGRYTPEYLAGLQFHLIAPENWKWTGPFGGEQLTSEDQGAVGMLETVFTPETSGMKVEWKPVVQTEDRFIDFQKLTGLEKPAVVYALAEISSSETRDAILILTCDCYAEIWLNGLPVSTINHLQSGSRDYRLASAPLQAGNNRILVKVRSGKGFRFGAGYWSR